MSIAIPYIGPAQLPEVIMAEANSGLVLRSRGSKFPVLVDLQDDYEITDSQSWVGQMGAFAGDVA